MNLVRGYCLLTLFILTACGEQELPTAGPNSELKLYVFDCGHIRFQNIEVFSIGNDETDVRELIVPCYIIEHPKGRLLWDGGLSSATADIEGWQGEEMQLRLDTTLAEQMAGIGLDMASFNFMAFSHMHFDHVGVANEVQGAILLIQKAEYDAAFADPPTLPGADPVLYAGLKDVPKVQLEGDHDVFGDGRVRIISTPGHTPGHQALFIDLANTGPIVLSGDLYHFAISREKRRVPTFNSDAGQTLWSMDRIDQLLAETGAELWIEHELEFFRQLNKPPAYHD